MKRIACSTLILFLLLGLCLWNSSPSLHADDKKQEKKELDRKYKKWLEEVDYIITKREREAFRRMPSNEMRDLFVMNFWEVRDPTPGTPKNEFMDEHYKRLDYANEFLGRETFRVGWRTDRGRMYILLGEPRDIQRYYDTGKTYPLELWFYDAGGLPGIPPFFYLIFFKRYGAGEYELYSPMQDGPHKLLAGFMGDAMNYQQPYEELREISVELARASLSLDPSDPIDYLNMRPSLGSEMLLAKINDLPNRLVNPGYVKNMLDGVPTVTVKYTYQLLDLAYFAEVYKNNAGDYFLHYAVQLDPEQIKAGQYEDKIYTTFEISGEIKDANNVSIKKINDMYNIELTEEEFKKARSSPFALEGKSAIIPGEYTLTLMIINRVSKEYGSIEKRIVVPEKEGTLRINTPMLAIKRMEGPKEIYAKVRPFTFDQFVVVPNVKKEFPLGTYLYLYFQIFLPESDESINRQLLTAKYTIMDQEKVVWEDNDSLANYLEDQANTLSLMRPVQLNFGLGDFKLKVSLTEGDQEKLSSELIDFKVLNPQNVPYPLVFARRYEQDSSFTYNLQKAAAYIAQGNIPEAIKELQSALEKNPDFLEATKTLARLHLESKQYEEVVDLLREEIIKQPKDYEYLIYLAIAHSQLGSFYDAIRFYERARMEGEPSAELLNALAEVYLKSGNNEKAKETFNQSLEIKPDQPELKEYLKQLEN